MTLAALVLRPEPGASATAARLRAAGLEARWLPLFETRALGWTVADPAAFDALLLTSGNAVRLAGPGLDALAHLPVVAVGAATASAARSAGLQVAHVGAGDAASAVAGAGAGRLLHLAGRDRVALPDVTAVTVYAAEERTVTRAELVAAATGAVALLHSPRAAGRFAALAGDARTTIRCAALSDAVAEAAGKGWAALATAHAPTDAALVELAARLAIDP